MDVDTVTIIRNINLHCWILVGDLFFLKAFKQLAMKIIEIKKNLFQIFLKILKNVFKPLDVVWYIFAYYV